MEKCWKRVLLTSNGDDISVNLAYSLVKQGCRLVLMGDEDRLRSIADRISDSVKSTNAIDVVGLNMENDSEAIFNGAVEKACHVLGMVDAFVNAYTYEGKMEDPLMVTEDDFKRTVKINFMAVWFLVKAVGRKMRDQGSGGSIVLLTSINGAERGLYKGAAASSSCFGGVNQLMKELDQMEWDPKSSTWNAMRSNNMFSVDLKLGSLEQMGDIPIMDTFKNSTSSPPLSKRGRPRGTGAQTTVYCSVDGCNSDLSHGREYHRRHRVCERHSKTPVVLIGAKEQRFCQQCSRFHSLGEFDDAKRSCRKRLDGHNRRRRKSQPENIYMTTSGCFQTPHSGSELLQFCYPDNWPGISEPEKALYGSRNHTLTNPVSSMWSISSVKGEKQSPYLSGINHQTVLQSSPNDISAARTSTGSLHASFDRTTMLSNSECALSLLSSYPAHSSGMCMGPSLPPLIMSSSPQFSCSKGLEGESSASVSSSSTTNNSYIFGGFHPGQDGFSENRSSRIFPFSLQ